MLRAALASLLLAAAQPALAACPEWLVSDMEASAVPSTEIARMCGPAPSRSILPAPRPSVTGQGVVGGLLGQEAARRQPGSSRCVPETGPACATVSLRPLGSPCWCADKAGPREGTIR